MNRISNFREGYIDGATRASESETLAEDLGCSEEFGCTPVSADRWARSLIAIAAQFVLFWVFPKVFEKDHFFRKITGNTFWGAIAITGISCGIELYHQAVRHQDDETHVDWDYVNEVRCWDPMPMAVFTLQGFSTGIGSMLANGSRHYTAIARRLGTSGAPFQFDIPQVEGGWWARNKAIVQSRDIGFIQAGQPLQWGRLGSYMGRTFALNLLVSGFWCLFFIPYALAEEKPLKEQLKYITTSMLAQFSLGWMRRMIAWRVSVPNTFPYYVVNDGLYIAQQSGIAYFFGSH